MWITPPKATKIKVIYDNGGESLDRYCVYFNSKNACGLYDYLSMSEHPSHPQGFGQHGIGQIGKHNGKRIAFKDLPVDCQSAVRQDLK